MHPAAGCLYNWMFKMIGLNKKKAVDASANMFLTNIETFLLNVFLLYMSLVLILKYDVNEMQPLDIIPFSLK